MRYAILLALLVSIFTVSCDKKNETLPQTSGDYIVFGWFGGLCSENCVDIYKIEGGLLYKNTSTTYPSGDGSIPYSGTFEEQSNMKYVSVKDLKSKVPDDLWLQTNTTFGMPNAYDQGGYYVELFSDDILSNWVIDTDPVNLPNWLNPFASELFDAQQALAD